MGHLREAYAYHFSHAELTTRGFPFKKCLRGCLRGSCCKNNLKMMVLKTRNETCHRRRAMQFLDAFFHTCQVSEGCCLSSFFCSSSPRPPRQSSSPSVSPILFAKLLANPLRQLRIAVCTAGPHPPGSDRSVHRWTSTKGSDRSVHRGTFSARVRSQCALLVTSTAKVRWQSAPLDLHRFAR